MSSLSEEIMEIINGPINRQKAKIRVDIKNLILNKIKEPRKLKNAKTKNLI